MLKAKEQFNMIIKYKKRFRNKIIIQSVLFIIGMALLIYKSNLYK